MIKVYIAWAKNYSGVIFHKTEERYKTCRGIDSSFQNWHKEVDEIWPEHSKVSKMLILMGSFWAKYILFKLKKYRGIAFHETEEGYKIWRVIDLSFQNWHKKFDKFWPEQSKVSKMLILMGSFWATYILFVLKKYTWVIFHEAKKNTKFGGESTCCFKVGIRNLTNFNLSTQKSQRFSLWWAPFKQSMSFLS